MKKKPVAVIRNAHGPMSTVSGAVPETTAEGGSRAGCVMQSSAMQPELPSHAPDVTGWVQVRKITSVYHIKSIEYKSSVMWGLGCAGQSRCGEKTKTPNTPLIALPFICRLIPVVNLT